MSVPVRKAKATRKSDATKPARVVEPAKAPKPWRAHGNGYLSGVVHICAPKHSVMTS